MKANWWKYLAVVLVIYSVVAGFLLPVPRLAILHESIRNLYFHVPMWFGMIALFIGSCVYSIRYLRAEDSQNNTGTRSRSNNVLDGRMTSWQRRNSLDIAAVECANIGLILGVLGMATGMVWARYTWGAWWSGDVKQNASAILLLLYLAYLILRGSISEERMRAKVSAVYNIFAAASIVPLLFVLPRMTASLHPGNGGNPAFGNYDLDETMRLVFYPAVIAWILIGFWMAQQRIELRKIEETLLENE